VKADSSAARNVCSSGRPFSKKVAFVCVSMHATRPERLVVNVCHARISLIEHEQVDSIGCLRQLPEQRRPSDETHIGLEHARVVAAPAQLG
jgi:hypothetical protein